MRWTHHKIDLNNNIHHNKHLQSSWNKYGQSSFSFYIIEKCDCKDINKREQYWINYYDTFYNGYNLDFGGNGISGYKHTEKEIEKMRLSSNPLCVLQFSMDFKLINKWIGGVSHASKELNITKDSIKARCERTNKHMTPYKNSYWIYEEEYNDDNFSWEKYLNNEKIIICKKSKSIKKIFQYSIDKKLIKVWNGYSELGNNDFDCNIIKKICKKTSTMNVYKNCFWCLNNDDIHDIYFSSVVGYKNKAIENKKRKVVQLDDNMNVINNFNSIKEASDYINVSHSCIIKAIKNNGTSGGYKWMYA